MYNTKLSKSLVKADVKLKEVVRYFIYFSYFLPNIRLA